MKKSQAAMEFLLVYGWVILAALVAIFAFIQFGSFSAEAFAVCNVGSGFTCVSSQITTSGVDLYIQNALPVDLTNVVVNITNTNQGKCIASSPKNIAAQGKEEFFISCSGIIDESNFKGDIKITYTKSGSGLSQLSSGSLTGKTLKDKTAPLITINIPISNENYPAILFLDYVVSDKGSLTCWYSLSGVNGNVNLPGCANTNIGPFTDGSHTLILFARDVSGNQDSKSVTFTTSGYGGSCIDSDNDCQYISTCGGSDCGDNTKNIYLGASETCNEVDDDCDGQIDEGCNNCEDNDVDSYYNKTCGGIDCNDNNANVNPGFLEDINENPTFCSDGLDNDCDLMIDAADPGCGGATNYCDVDLDGYSSDDPLCEIGGPYDCDDNNPNINPTAPELCTNSIDDDCDGGTNEGCSGEAICGNADCEAGEKTTKKISCTLDCINFAQQSPPQCDY